jgi:hypothetical protein
VPGLSFEATVVRISRLAACQGGSVTAADIERDGLLSADRRTTSAAGRMLAGGTGVVAQPEMDPARWFPFAELRFTRVLSGRLDRE